MSRNGQTKQMRTSRTRIRTTKEKIGPRKAKKYLATQTSNRRVSKRRVDWYAQQMEEGNWSLNGQTITFGRKGNLIDGQHRLHAVIQSRVPLEVLVVRGITDDKAQATIDCGMGRTAAHVMEMHGEKNTNFLAALLKYIWRYENRSDSSLARNRAGNLDIMDVLRRHPDARMAVRLPTQLGIRELGGCQTQAMFCKYVLMQALDEEWANQFIREIATGANLDYDSPTLTLRRTLLRLKRGLGHNGSGFRDHVMALFIKAMNAWAQDQPAKQLRYSAMKDPFPRAFDEGMFNLEVPA